MTHSGAHCGVGGGASIELARHEAPLGEVVLAEAERLEGLSSIDDSGFPCLAVISNRLTRNVETVWRARAREASEEFPLEVWGKSLRIVLVRGPVGELIEMIGF